MLAFGLATLLGFAALAIDMGNAFNIQNELQKSTTTAALAGASAFNPQLSSSQNMTAINSAVQDAFNLAKDSEPGLSTAQIVGNVQVDTTSGAVRLQSRAQAPTFFINIIGIKTLEVNARAAALNYPTAYMVMNDLFPLPADDQLKTVAFPESRDLAAADTHYYNPPPGGKIQLVCTLPMSNSPGAEIIIVESGDIDGYKVYVSSNPGGPWYNISAFGTPVAGDPGPLPPPGETTAPPDQMRFFGSGSFDLQGTGIENARYVAIVDDAYEDGFQAADKATYVDPLVPDVALVGEAGPAMEIDAVLLPQHAVSIDYNDLSKDENKDGIIDAHNKLIGSYDTPGMTLVENQKNKVSSTEPATNTMTPSS